MKPNAAAISLARLLWKVTASALCVLALHACGGGGDVAAPPASEGSATIGAAGGTVNGPDGTSVVLPANAVGTATTFRVARDSTGAPAVPDGLTALSAVYTITPHVNYLVVPALVTLPVDATKLAADGPAPTVMIAQPGGDWEALPSGAVQNGFISAQTIHFSYVLVVQTPVLFVKATLTSPVPLPRWPASDSPYPYFAVSAPVTLDVQLDIPQRAFEPPTRQSLYCGEPMTLDIIVLTVGNSGISRVQTNTLGPYPSAATAHFSVTLDASWNGYTTIELREHCRLSSLDGGGGVGPGWTNEAAIATFFVDVAASPGAPVITLQPQSTSVIAGQSASFSVTATAAGTLGVDWQRSNNAGTTWASTGTTTATLTLPSAGLADSGAMFRAHLCDTVGTQQTCIDSASATLGVTSAPVAPMFTTQPANLSVLQGQTASITVSASGQPAPRLRIYQGATPGGTLVIECAAPTTGSTATCTYTSAALAANQSGLQFYAVGDNVGGSVTSNVATVTVTTTALAPAITSQPSGTSTHVGSGASFTTAVTGTAPLSYQWTFNGSNLSDHAAGTSASGVAGAHSATLSLTNVQAGDAGGYALQVSNGQGAVVSAVATLTVDPAPNFSSGCTGSGDIGWCWAAPRPQGNWLNGVALTGQHAVVVGNHGSVLTSADGGLSWTPGVSGTATLLTGVIASGSQATAIGVQGTILHSDDGGATWTSASQGFFSTIDQLLGITAVPGTSTQIAVGTNSAVLRSIDGGRNWMGAFVGPGGTAPLLHAVASGVTSAFPLGWVVAVGEGGAVLRSTNGGVNWAYQNTGITAPLLTVASMGGAVVLASDNNLGLYRSTDAGGNWSRIGVPDLQTNIAILLGSGGGVAYAVSTDGGVFRSDDAGITWTRHTDALYVNAVAGALDPAHPNAVVIAGGPGRSTVSSDGGDSWSDPSASFSGAGNNIRGFAFMPGAPLGLAGSADSTGPGLARSSDGGLSWASANASADEVMAVAYTSALNLRYVAMVGGQRGRRNSIYMSSDGAGTFFVQGTDTQDLDGLAFASQRIGVAVGDNNAMVRSVDAGTTWNRVTPTGTADGRHWAAVTFASELNGVAVGFDPSGRAPLVYTNDAGATWTASTHLPPSPEPHLGGIAFVPNSTTIALAAGYDGVTGAGFVWRTADAGVTWTEVLRDPNRALTAVAIDTSTEGNVVAVGIGGVILRSFDFGFNWQAIESGTDNTLLAVAWDWNTNAFVAGGVYGTVLRNVQGGKGASALQVSGKARAAALRRATTGRIAPAVRQ